MQPMCSVSKELTSLRTVSGQTMKKPPSSPDYKKHKKKHRERDRDRHYEKDGSREKDRHRDRDRERDRDRDRRRDRDKERSKNHDEGRALDKEREGHREKARLKVLDKAREQVKISGVDLAPSDLMKEELHPKKHSSTISRKVRSSVKPQSFCSLLILQFVNLLKYCLF